MCGGINNFEKITLFCKVFKYCYCIYEIKSYICIYKNDNDMKNETLKNKVEARLIKNGNNVNEVKEMIDLHFEYASSTYTTVKSIAECIITIY